MAALHDACHQVDGELRARFRGLELRSAFQPIFSTAHPHPVGFEALVRAFTADGRPVSPLALFASARSTAQTVHLDRLCRLLHVANFVRRAPPATWLFLNINPRVIVEGRHFGAFFRELLEHYRLSPEQVVVEILEGGIRNEAELAGAVRYYRQLGCLVAIDDFGTGASNFDRIGRTAPDIIKLDRGLLQQARTSASARRIFPNLVELLHDSGSLVLVEGVETDVDALRALDSSCDFVQGYYFGRPRTGRPRSAGSPLPDLSRRLESDRHQRRYVYQQWLRPYLQAFEKWTAQLSAGVAAERASRHLLSNTGVLRCFVLDEHGVQVGSNIDRADDHGADCIRRFAPLRSGGGADWSRRGYFRNAREHPGTLQVTSPYLSLTGADLCITLSMALADRSVVACCDIAWKEPAD